MRDKRPLTEQRIKIWKGQKRHRSVVMTHVWLELLQMRQEGILRHVSRESKTPWRLHSSVVSGPLCLWCSLPYDARIQTPTTRQDKATGNSSAEMFARKGKSRTWKGSTRDMQTWNVNADERYAILLTKLYDDYSCMSGGLEPRAPSWWPHGFVFRLHSVIAELSSTIEQWNARKLLFKPPCECKCESRFCQ